MYFEAEGEDNFKVWNALIFCMYEVVTYFCFYVIKKKCTFANDFE